MKVNLQYLMSIMRVFSSSDESHVTWDSFVNAGLARAITVKKNINYRETLEEKLIAYLVLMQDNKLIKVNKDLFAKLSGFSEGYTDKSLLDFIFAPFFLTERGFVLSTSLEIPSIYNQLFLDQEKLYCVNSSASLPMSYIVEKSNRLLGRYFESDLL